MKTEFDKLFHFMSRRFDDIDATLALKSDKADIESLRNAVDGMYGQLDVLEVEYGAFVSSLTRLEGNIDKLNGSIARLSRRLSAL